MNNRKLLFALLCILAVTQTGCMMNEDMVRQVMVDLALQNLRNINNFQARPANPAPVQNLNAEDIDRRVRDADNAINEARNRIGTHKREWNDSWSGVAIFPGLLTGALLFRSKMENSVAISRHKIDPFFQLSDDRFTRFLTNSSWSKLLLISAAIGTVCYFALCSLQHTRFGKNCFNYPEVVRAKNDLNADLNARNELYREIYRRYAGEGGQRANERARAADLQRRQQADRAEIARLQQEARIGQRDIRQAAHRAEILRRIEREHPELLAAQ